MLLEHDFALILLDVRMPELDGLETARLIKGRARTRDVPIVFLTAARDEVDDILRGYGVGAVDYVLKPFDPDLLRSKVAVFAELEQNRRALKRSETLLRGGVRGRADRQDDPRLRAPDRAHQPCVRAAGRTRRGPARGSRTCWSCAIPTIASAVGVDRIATAGRRRVDSAPAHGRARAARPGSGSSPRRSTPATPAQPLLLLQWVDLSARRRAEQARAELLLEHAARTNAEAMAERLSKLQALSGAIESLSLHQLIAELAVRLAELFEVDVAEVEIEREAASRSSCTRLRVGGAVQSLEATPALDQTPGGAGDDRGRGGRGAAAGPLRPRLQPQPSDRCSTTRPSAPRLGSVAHSCTSRSTGSRWSSSAACCPSGCPRSPGCSWPRTTRPPGPRSAATGTTRSRCPAAGSGSCSATSPGGASRRPRRWDSCAA